MKFDDFCGLSLWVIPFRASGKIGKLVSGPPSDPLLEAMQILLYSKIWRFLRIMGGWASGKIGKLVSEILSDPSLESIGFTVKFDDCDGLWVVLFRATGKVGKLVSGPRRIRRLSLYRFYSKI